MGTYRLTMSGDRELSLTLRDDRGKVLLQSGGFPTRAAAMARLVQLRMCSSYPAYYQRIDEAGRGFGFRLLGPDGRGIGAGQWFETARRRERAVEAVAMHGPGSALVDDTGGPVNGE